MPLYKVGSLYNPSRRSWPEASQYNFRSGMHELVVFFPDPSRHEVEAVSKGECEFALFAEAGQVVLCYRFEARGRGIPWSDAPYSWHRVKDHDPAEATLPPPWEEGSPETRALLLIHLVDASTGILRAMRQVSLSPEFTRALHRAIWEQAHTPWDPAAYDRGLEEIYRRFPTTSDLIRACPVRTRGGA